MAFDPVAYLAKKTQQAQPAPQGFDPAVYLQSKLQAPAAAATEQPGTVEALLRGAAQGATLNFSDELTAGAEALFTDKTYDQAVAESRTNYEAAQQAHPIASGIGGLAGGLATAVIPGLGAGKIAQAGGAVAKALEAGKLGAKLGAVGALGASEDKSVEDVVKGGVTGAVTGAAFQGATSALGASGRWLFNRIKDGLKPSTQLGLAVGANAADLNPANPMFDKLQRALGQAEKEGLFASPANGSLDEQVIFDRIQATLSEKGAAIGERVRRFGDARAPDTSFRELYNSLGQQVADIIERKAPPAMRGGLADDLNLALKELAETDGKLADMWQLKSSSGHWAGKAWTMAGQPPPVKEGYMAMNSMLNDFLNRETAKLGDTTLQTLNRSYSAAATIEPLLGRAIGKLEGAPSSLGLTSRDLGAGGMLAGAAAGLGAGAFAAPIGFAGAAANQYMRSVPGRVARAQLGRKLEDMSQKLSVMQGAIPRTTKGAQDWLRQNMGTLPPQIQQAAAAIVGAPQDRAEQMLRGVIPQFAQYFAKSKYPSEVDGRVSEMSDKMAIRRELEKLQLPATQMALKLSALNRTGTIPIEVYDPSEYGNEMEAFAAKMMGGSLP